MGKLAHIVIHCADTYPSFELNKAILDQWHQGPRDEMGQVVYKGRRYPSRASLPDDKIGGKSIKLLWGRGWDRDGYTKLFHRDGSVEEITPNNGDDDITNAEITWGATGFNTNSIHVCLEGGRSEKTKPQPAMKGAEDLLYTPEQMKSLTDYLLSVIADHPHIKIAGHYMLTSQKSCPSFDVSAYLLKINKSEYCFKP